MTHSRTNLSSRTRASAYRNESGFTLVELMVVIVILGSLVAIAGPSVWRALFQSNKGICETQMHNFSQAVDMYKLDKKRLPGSLDDLTQSEDGVDPLFESIPDDPWGNPYDYRIDGNKYRIISAGPNGTPGDDDDLEWPKPRQ